MCPLAICLSLEKYSGPLPIFRFFFLSLLRCKASSYILDMSLDMVSDMDSFKVLLLVSVFYSLAILLCDHRYVTSIYTKNIWLICKDYGFVID